MMGRWFYRWGASVLFAGTGCLVYASTRSNAHELGSILIAVGCFFALFSHYPGDEGE